MKPSIFTGRWASNVKELPSERRPVSHKATVSSIQGKTKIHLNAQETWYESGLEKDFLTLCASENRVQSATAQPFTLHYKDMLAKASRRYTPDFLLEIDTSKSETWSIHLPKRLLVEVKPYSKLLTNRRRLYPKFHAARHWCRKNDAHFLVFTDETITMEELDSARMLERGMLAFPDAILEEHLDSILNNYGGLYLQGLVEMLRDKGNNQRKCVDAIMRRIAIGEIAAPLHEGLKPNSMLRYLYEPL